jgi:hypothetical protein
MFFLFPPCYLGTMNTLSKLHSALSAKPHPITMAVITSQEKGNIAELIAKMALRGPLTIIAGSEWIPAYKVARLLRHKTKAVKQTLDRVHLTRAFTCYQLLDLIETTRPIPEPLFVLDFLHTFHSPDIPLNVRLRVLRQCTQNLQRLSLSRPVAFLIHYTPVQDYEHFYPLLETVANEIINIEAQAGAAPQLRLF